MKPFPVPPLFAAVSLTTMALLSGSVSASSLPAFAQAAATAPPLTASDLRAALHDDARNNAQLADTVRAWFGTKALAEGPRPKIENSPGVFRVAFAIEAPGLGANETPGVVSEDGTLSLQLQRIGNTDVYANVIDRSDSGIACRYAYLVKGKKLGMGQIEDYPRNPEEVADPQVPHGKTAMMPPFRSKVFEGTTRDWWVYIPAQYSAEKPPAVMVFQDGGGAKNWAPTMLDNLIAKGDIPVMVGIFINPGTRDDKKSNRSFEYDSLGDRYPRFLLEEILPEVEKTTTLTHDPDQRGIFGVSSGGICAFTVAWEKPDEFRKVFTVVGSFTNLQGGPTGTAGGNTYPAIIRHWAGWQHEGKPKPIRMFQTDGANDLDNGAGSWPLSNQQIDRALTYGGYDHKFVFGNGFHGDRFGRFHFPDGMRWLWRKPDSVPVVALPTK